MDAPTGLVSSVDYLERWSWRTWDLLHPYTEQWKNLEAQVVSLQKEVKEVGSLKRRLEDGRDLIEDEGSTCRSKKTLYTKEVS